MKETSKKEKELFVRYATAASEAMFDYPCNFFKIDDCEGYVAYRIEYNCAIVFGGPVCRKEDSSKLLNAFHQFCENSKLNIIYVIVSREFKDWSLKNGFHLAIDVCDELIFDPQEDPLVKSHRLKHRVDKAIKHGLTFHEYTPFDKSIEESLIDVGHSWKKAIKGPNVYLGHLNFFDSYIGKRWFYVKDGEKITSMVMLSKLDASNGYLLKFLVTDPNAIHDTSEFLMVSLLNILKEEGCTFLSKGMEPKSAIGELVGFHTFCKCFMRNIYKFVNVIFKFQKRKEYWLRYHPRIEPAYLVFKNKKLKLNEFKALIKIFKTSYI